MDDLSGCKRHCCCYSVNSEMLMGKLRGEFGFEGIVATDCGALNDARKPPSPPWYPSPLYALHESCWKTTRC